MQKKMLDGMGLAIAAICFALIMPIVTYICGGIGLAKANAHIQAEPDTPTTARTICITALIITSALLFLSVVGASRY